MGNTFSDSPINYEPVERWASANAVLSIVKIGDLIEIRRYGGAYSHWGVYVGEDHVVNYGRKNPRTSLSLVQKELLVDVSVGKSGATLSENVSLGTLLSIDNCRINNLEDAARIRNLSAYSGDTIAQRALARVGEECPYNVVNNNCEVFATECRYGKGFTCQPIQVQIAVGHIAFGGRTSNEEVADYL